MAASSQLMLASNGETWFLIYTGIYCKIMYMPEGDVF